MTDTITIEATPILKIDLGCGPNKQPGFIGVDQFSFDGKVDVLLNIGKDPWPWADSSVDQIHCSHFLEHLTNFEGKWERVHFWNELYRVLKPMTSDPNTTPKATIIFPHWCSTRFYGDPTHREALSEFSFYYLSKDWRAANSPHCDSRTAPGPWAYSCDLDCSWGNSMHQALLSRNAEFQQDAMAWKKEAIQDIIATVKAKK